MNRPTWHKIVSDLRGNWVRSLLVTASLTVGLFAIGVITTTYYVIRDDIARGYAAIDPANIIIKTDLFDKDLVDHFRHFPGVKDAAVARTVDMRVAAGPGKWNSISIKSDPAIAQLQVNQVRMLSGNWPPGDGEIALDQHKLAQISAHLGDTITIETLSDHYRQLKVAAIVQDQTIGLSATGGGFFNAPIQGYVNQKTLEMLEIPRPYDLVNNLYLTISGNGDDLAWINTVAASVSDEVKYRGITIAYTDTRASTNHPNRDLLEAVSQILVILGFLVVGLSGVLITNTLQALLKQQIQQIGIMKTVGARRVQIIAIYMILILIYGLLAYAIAVPLAYRAAYGLLTFIVTQTNIVIQGQHLIPQVIFLQLFLALVVPQAAAFAPIWQGARVSVIEALSGISFSRTAARTRLDRWISNVRRLPRPTRISIRNVFRNKGRLVLTVLVLSLAGAVFIATFNVRVSMANYIDQIRHYFLADVSVNTLYPYRTQEIQDILSTLPEVGRVEGWVSLSSKLVLGDGTLGDRVVIYGSPANSPLITPTMIQGRWFLPGDQNAVVLNDRFMYVYPNVKVGDTITLHIRDEDTQWVIVGFYRLAGKMAGIIGYANYDYVSKVNGVANRANTFRIVATHPGGEADQDRLAHAVEARLTEQKIFVSDISTAYRINNNSAAGFATLTVFLLFMALLIALVGSIGLAGTMSMNVMERTREIGVMRAIGASDRTLMLMVILEGMIIGLISWLIGSLLSFPISKVMADGVNLALFGTTSRLGFTPTGFVIWLGLVILLSVVASYIPARNAARLTIREVLAYE